MAKIPDPPDQAALPPAGQTLINIRRAIGGTVVVGVGLVALLVLLAWWIAGWPTLRRSDQVDVGTVFELFKLVFPVVAGVGGIVALVMAYRRQRVTEAQNVLAHAAGVLAHAADVRAGEDSDRADTKLFHERYAVAAGQLGAEPAAVRLAGAYAMAGLADDWEAGRQTCIDVLCAYLRMPYTPPQPPEPPASFPEWAPAHQRVGAEGQIRHTIIGIITAHLREGARTSWQGHDFDFNGAVFDGGDFSGVSFSGGQVSFDGAEFPSGKVFFTGATFAGGQVSFVGAAFSGGSVIFDDAIFSGCFVDLFRATFSGGRVSFESATFSGGEVSFYNATFSGGVVYFGDATFSGSVVWLNATYTDDGVDFTGATFSGGKVRFEYAMFEGGEVDLRGTTVTAPSPLVFGDWRAGPPAELHLPVTGAGTDGPSTPTASVRPTRHSDGTTSATPLDASH